jgi:hypothetical protein
MSQADDTPVSQEADAAPGTGDSEDSTDSALPRPTRTGHAKMPEHMDDDMLARAAALERVEAGTDDFAPDDVPPATDPLPEGSSEAADLAQRGLLGDTTAPDEEA